MCKHIYPLDESFTIHDYEPFISFKRPIFLYKLLKIVENRRQVLDFHYLYCTVQFKLYNSCIHSERLSKNEEWQEQMKHMDFFNNNKEYKKMTNGRRKEKECKMIVQKYFFERKLSIQTLYTQKKKKTFPIFWEEEEFK